MLFYRKRLKSAHAGQSKLIVLYDAGQLKLFVLYFW